MPGPGSRRRMIEKPKDGKKVLSRMIKDFKNEKFLLLIVVLACTSASVLAVLSPIFLGNFLNEIIPTSSTDLSTSPLFDVTASYDLIVKRDFFFSRFGVLMAFYVISALFSYITSIMTAYISNYSARDLRERISGQILH